MSVTLPLKVDEDCLEKIVEEYNMNESSFIHEFLESILQQLADKTKKISETALVLNMMNPFGFIQPTEQIKTYEKEITA